MCQESLINYLVTELKGNTDIPVCEKKDIETLIKYVETVVEHDSRVVGAGRETDRYSFKLPESIRKHAKLTPQSASVTRRLAPAPFQSG